MSNDRPHLVLGTTRLFAERSAVARLDLHHDEYGFLQRSSRFFGSDRLLDRPCSLVVAPPWVGKSFTAKRIADSLNAGSTGPCATPGYHQFRDLEEFMSGQLLQPSWWSEWREGDRRATWIIDALEEGQRREHGLCASLIQLLEELSAEARRRLRLVAFAREGDLRQGNPDFEAKLRSIFGDDFMVAELLPLDVYNAREIVLQKAGSDGDWQRVLSLIKSNHLEVTAGYPAVLSFLSRQGYSAELSIRDVWKGVLQKLLEEHHYHYHLRPFQTGPERRFAASARIAAVLTLAGDEELANAEAPTGFPGVVHPTLAQILPIPEPTYQLATRDEAREALRSTMFRTTAAGHRFLHKNVREWMAAFGMARLPVAKLRPVLQASTGTADLERSIRPELSDLAQLLVTVHDSPEVQEWLRGALGPLPSDLFVSSLIEVRRILDRLEQLAAQGARVDLSGDSETLQPLVVAGLDQELAGRVQDSAKPTLARIMMLRIGVALELEKVLESAAVIIRDASQDEELRSWCAAGLDRSPRVDLLQPLLTFVDSGKPATRVEMSIASKLISAFVRVGLWTAARAFSWMSSASDCDKAGATQVLAATLAHYMTMEDAEAIVSSLGTTEIAGLKREVEECERQERWPPPRWQAYAAAVKKLALIEPAEPLRLRLLIPSVLSLGGSIARSESELVAAIEKAFRASENGRRELFQFVVVAQKAAGETAGHLWWWIHRLLDTDDLEWLVEHLGILAEGMPIIWQIALRLGEKTKDRTVKRRIRATVGQLAPDAASRYRELRAAERAHERQEKGGRQQDGDKRQIEEIDRELLANSRLSEQQLMWQLSWVNFSEDRARPRNLAGVWDDVSPALQEKVLGTCAAALDSVTPTQVPEGSTFPMVVEYEAQAFVAMLRLRQERFQLTPSRIERWLPAVLKSFRPEKFGVLEACLHVAPETTEDVLLVAVASELRNQSAYSVLLQDLPASLWTDRVARWAAEGIEGTQQVESRPRLLELLAARRPEEGLRISRSLLSDCTTARVLGVDDLGGLPDPLGLQAIEVLLALAPDEGWPRVEEGAALQGSTFLERLRGLGYGAREGLGVLWQSWPPVRIARLAKVLFEAFPPDLDPPETDGGHLVTTEFELGLLRWRVLEHLVRSPGIEASVAVEAAKKVHPQAGSYIEHLQATDAATALLMRPVISGPGIGVAEACKLLDQEYFRLIRSDEDLLEVVVEELENIERDIGYDHAMLFNASADGKTERRRREDALQAYVLRRLKDRLPEKVLDRETQVERGRRLDIRVMAPLFGSQDWATAVIEVKWSDNGGPKRGVSTALSEQLGKEYLLQERLRHGVFLVAWSGKMGAWKAKGVEGPCEKTAAALLEALRRQAEHFRSENPQIDIRPLVWDFQREAPSGRVRGRRSESALCKPGVRTMVERRGRDTSLRVPPASASGGAPAGGGAGDGDGGAGAAMTPGA